MKDSNQLRNNLFKKIFSVTGIATAMLFNQMAVAHPGHTSSLFHSHDSMGTTLFGLALLAVIGFAGVALNKQRKNNATRTVKAPIKPKQRR